jgi:hypothetical protein
LIPELKEEISPLENRLSTLKKNQSMIVILVHKPGKLPAGTKKFLDDHPVFSRNVFHLRTNDDDFKQSEDFLLEILHDDWIRLGNILKIVFLIGHVGLSV